MASRAVVVDASVALKWFLRDRPDEQDADRAVELLNQASLGLIRLVQPPHFLAEVAAVLARVKPDAVQADIRDLQLIEYVVLGEPEVYNTAIELAVRYQQHVFDTRYHVSRTAESFHSLLVC